MDRGDIRMDGARVPRAQLIEEIEREAHRVSGGIGTDFLIQRITREAIEEIEMTFAAAKDIPDRASRIAMLARLERMASCMLRISLNDEVDQVGPRMIKRTLRLSGLILLDVERQFQSLDDEGLQRYWDNAKRSQDLADRLYTDIGRLLQAEQHAEERERWKAEHEPDDFVPTRPRRSLLDVLLGRRREAVPEPQ